MYRFSVRPFVISHMQGVYEPNGVRPFTFSKLQLKGTSLLSYITRTI